MSSNIKTAASAPPTSSRGFYRVAIVGAGSLKGKEVAEILDQRNFPAGDVKLLDDEDALGKLEALKDEVTFIQSVRAEQFEKIDFTFFADGANTTGKNSKLAIASGSAIVDLTYALENDPGVTVRAPSVERQFGQFNAPELQPGPVVAAHPVSVALALILGRLSAVASISSAAATVLQPASEYGQKGMDELHEQTVGLLSFQPLPKKFFDVQVAFNAVPRYGSEAASTLISVNERIVRHYRTIVPAKTPVPSVLVLQAPTFHGYAFSLNVTFSGVADVAELSKALAGEHVKLVPGSEEAPNNVNAAGQDDILVSITPDAADANAAWVWIAFDNLRLAAITAVECAEAMAASRPRGQVQ